VFYKEKYFLGHAIRVSNLLSDFFKCSFTVVMLDNPQLQHRIDNQSRKMCSKFEYGPWIQFLKYILFYEQNRVDISVSA